MMAGRRQFHLAQLGVVRFQLDLLLIEIITGQDVPVELDGGALLLKIERESLIRLHKGGGGVLDKQRRERGRRH
jgi:hypothetical protein